MWRFEPGTFRTQVRNVTSRGGLLGHRFKKSTVRWHGQHYGFREYTGKLKVVTGIWSASAATTVFVVFLSLAVEDASFRNTIVVRRTRCRERMRMRKREKFYRFLRKSFFVCVEYTCCYNLCVCVCVASHGFWVRGVCLISSKEILSRTFIRANSRSQFWTSMDIKDKECKVVPVLALRAYGGV